LLEKLNKKHQNALKENVKMHKVALKEGESQVKLEEQVKQKEQSMNAAK